MFFIVVGAFLFVLWVGWFVFLSCTNIWNILQETCGPSLMQAFLSSCLSGLLRTGCSFESLGKPRLHPHTCRSPGLELLGLCIRSLLVAVTPPGLKSLYLELFPIVPQSPSPISWGQPGLRASRAPLPPFFPLCHTGFGIGQSRWPGTGRKSQSWALRHLAPWPAPPSWPTYSALTMGAPRELEPGETLNRDRSLCRWRDRHIPAPPDFSPSKHTACTVSVLHLCPAACSDWNILWCQLSFSLGAECSSLKMKLSVLPHTSQTHWIPPPHPLAPSGICSHR